MSASPLLCRHCGGAIPSSTDFCPHCDQRVVEIVDLPISEKDFSAKKQKHGITRRKILYSLAGATSVLALGGGMWIWRTRRPQLLTYQSHGAAVNALSWSPDGNSIASGDANGNVYIWDPATGTTLQICQQPSTQDVSSISWSPDSTSILVGYTNMLAIWHAQSGKNTFTTSHLTGPAAYSPQGTYKPCYIPYQLLIAACQNNTSPTNSVHIFSANNLNTPIASLNSGMISTLVFSPEGNQQLALAAASPVWQHGGLAIYQPLPPVTTTATCDATNTGPYYVNNFSCEGEHSVSWSPDGAFIIGGSTTGNALVHYLSSEQLYELNNPAQVVAVSWYPVQEKLPTDAKPQGRFYLFGYMATADAAGVVRVWGNNQQSVVAMRVQQSIRCLAWSPDGNFLAAGSADGSVQVWQARLSDLTPAWQDVK